MFSFSKVNWRGSAPIVALVAAVAIVALAVVSRVAFLGEIPRGFYCDESNIGYNAILISETGKDEFGERMPLFFKAFGDARKPALIYMAAATVKILGPSEFSIRFASVVFFFIFLAAFWLLIRRMFVSSAIQIYALAAASFLPWFFKPSRAAIEVSAHPALVMIALLFFHRAFVPSVAPANAPADEAARSRRRLGDAAVAGFFTAMSLYTYEAGTVLAFPMLAILILVYFRREYRGRVAAAAAGFVVPWLPWLWYAVSHPGSMTTRFRDITYWHSALPLIKKVNLYLETYLGYLSPDFLLSSAEILNGKPWAGESHGVLFGVVFVLALVGALRFLVSGRIWTDRFAMFLMLNFWFTPVAGAISRAHHSSLIRVTLMGIYFLIFSCHGLVWILEVVGARRRAVVFAVVCAILAGQTAYYMRYYFVDYTPRTMRVFESWNFKTALQRAIDEKPSRIVVSTKANQPQAHRDFYSRLVRNPDKIPIEMGVPAPEKGACVIYFAWNQPALDAQPGEYRQIDLGVPGAITMLRCYYDRS